MKAVSLLLPEAYVEALDRLVRRKLYPSRNEAIRFAIRDFLHAENMREVKA
jgi:Arc/MetJ-type ribon-helix-helix transcriptional regulator